MNLQDELLSFGKKWDDAMVNNIAKDISRFMSDDWVIIGTDGGITPKNMFLEWIESGDLIHTRMDSDEMRIRIYGNTGVVTARGTSSGTYKGKTFSFYEWSRKCFHLRRE